MKLYENVLYSVNIFMLNHVQLSTVSLVGSLHLSVSNYLYLSLKMFSSGVVTSLSKASQFVQCSSMCSSLLSCCCIIILDNETSTMVIIMVFIGLCIDIWKVTKVTTITLDRNNLIAGVLPRLSFIDQPSYVQSSTKEYDKVCHDETQCVCIPVPSVLSIHWSLTD